jgi:hypothetical protein
VKRTWTIIGVRDVARSFEWYLSLFGQPLTRPAQTTSANFATRMARYCSAFISGVHMSIPH